MNKFVGNRSKSILRGKKISGKPPTSPVASKWNQVGHAFVNSSINGSDNTIRSNFVFVGSGITYEVCPKYN